MARVAVMPCWICLFTATLRCRVRSRFYFVCLSRCARYSYLLHTLWGRSSTYSVGILRDLPHPRYLGHPTNGMCIVLASAWWPEVRGLIGVLLVSSCKNFAITVIWWDSQSTSHGRAGLFGHSFVAGLLQPCLFSVAWNGSHRRQKAPNDRETAKERLT